MGLSMPGALAALKSGEGYGEAEDYGGFSRRCHQPLAASA